jgi:hypothetical protein
MRTVSFQVYDVGEFFRLRQDNTCAETDIYVTDMLRCMRDVNVDNNNVGWYQSTYMNSWLDADGPTVETQFQFQVTIACNILDSSC